MIYKPQLVLKRNLFIVKLFHVHLGFKDNCLLWIVNGKIMDFLFIRIN